MIEHELDNPPIKELLNDLAHRIGDEMPQGWGFALLIFSYGERVASCSTSRRHSVRTRST